MLTTAPLVTVDNGALNDDKGAWFNDDIGAGHYSWVDTGHWTLHNCGKGATIYYGLRRCLHLSSPVRHCTALGEVVRG